MLFFMVSVLCSVLSVYEEHQKLLKELGGTKRGAENGWERKEQLINKLIKFRRKISLEFAAGSVEHKIAYRPSVRNIISILLVVVLVLVWLPHVT